MTHRLPTLPLLAALALTACSAEPEAPAAKSAAAAQPSPKYREVETPGAARDAAVAFRSDTADVVVAPRGSKGDKLEYKVRMKAGETLAYSWEAPGAGDLWHEFHGHTADTVSFYKKATGTKHAGVLVAPFEGIHGWYFENRSPDVVIVRLRMGGFYELVPEAPK